MATKATSVKNGAATPGDVGDQIEILRKDLAALTETIASLGKAKGDEAVTAAKAKASELRDKAADHAETARLQAMELQGQANDFIRNQPATALGIAAGLGFLIGYLGTRK